MGPLGLFTLSTIVVVRMTVNETSFEFNMDYPDNDAAFKEGLPPAYSTESNSTTKNDKASAHTIMLYHRKPGRLSPRNKVKTGDVIEKFEDTTMVPA